MKKILFLLLLLIPAVAMVSCDNDDDLPKVNFYYSLENATEVDGKIYVVQGDTLKITSLEVKNQEAGQVAIITAANYYWDGFYLGRNVVPPFGFDINITSNTPKGKHYLEIECPLYANDKAPTFALLVFDVMVVASQDDVPAAGDNVSSANPKVHKTATYVEP